MSTLERLDDQAQKTQLVPPQQVEQKDSDHYTRKFTGERQTSAGYIPALDGIRGIAMILVLLAHWAQSISVLPVHGYLATGVTTLSYVGCTGLDSFFVLSGFLITRILLAIKGKRWAIPNFLVRRVLKIFPLYFAVLAVVLFIVPADFRQNQLRMTCPNSALIWLFCFGQNFVDVYHHTWMYGSLDHFWSVSVEEHFYWLWPVAILFLCRRNVGWAAVGLIALSVAVRAWFWIVKHDPFACELLTFCRLDGLACGCLLAIMEACRLVNRRITGWLVVAILAGSAASFGVHQNWFGPNVSVLLKTIESVVCTGVIGLAVIYKDGWLGKALSNPVLTFFGVYSYGIYVYHHFFRPPLLPVTCIFGADKPNNAAFAYGIVHLTIAIVLALLSYHLFEKHFLKFKVNFAAGEAKNLSS